MILAALSLSVVVSFLGYVDANSLGGLDVGFPHYCNTIHGPKLNNQPKGYTLEQVTILHRHGDRVMYGGGKCWDNDSMSEGKFQCKPFQATSLAYHQGSEFQPELKKWLVGDKGVEGGLNLFQNKFLNNGESPLMYKNCAVGQLTQRGRVMQRATGQVLKKMYIDTGFLSSEFQKSEMYLRADISPRVIASLESLVSGMYPSQKGVQLFSLYVADGSIDPIAGSSFCPKGAQYDKAFEQTSQARAIKQEMDDIFNEMKSMVPGVGGDVDHLWDCMGVHLCHEYKLPWDKSGKTRDYFDRLEKLSVAKLIAQKSHPSVEKRAQVGFGFIIKEWYLNWLKIKNNQDDYTKFFEYSAHDTNIIEAFTAFGFSFNQWPPFSSLMQFEMYSRNNNRKDGKEFYIRFIYNGDILDFEFCKYESVQGLCPFDLFAKHMDTIVPGKNSECKSYLSTAYSSTDGIDTIINEKVGDLAANSALAVKAQAYSDFMNTLIQPSNLIVFTAGAMFSFSLLFLRMKFNR